MNIPADKLLPYFENYVCPICRTAPKIGGYTTWFRVQPASAQVLHASGAGKKSAYEKKIKDAIRNSRHRIASDTEVNGPLNVFDPNNVYGKGTKELDVCIGLFFGLSPSCADKDVDNMTKVFLDAIKGPGGLISDDKAVTHLEVIKRQMVATEISVADNYLVGVRISTVSRVVQRAVSFEWNSSVVVL